jgi:hypothetical protein
MSAKVRALVLLVVFAALSLAPFSGSAASAQTGNCDTTGTVNGSATPVAGVVGDRITFRGTGFTPGESVSFWFTLPNNGGTFGTPSPIPNGVNPDGSIGPLPFTIPQAFGAIPGRWAITFQGTPSGHQAIVYFCVGFRQAANTPTPPPAPTNTTAPATDTPVPATATTAATATSEATATSAATATTEATAVATAVATTPPAPPTLAPTEVVPPTEVAMPSPTAVVGGVTGGTPGMPRTGGESDLTPLAVILLAALAVVGTGVAVRRRAASAR